MTKKKKAASKQTTHRAPKATPMRAHSRAPMPSPQQSSTEPAGPSAEPNVPAATPAVEPSAPSSMAAPVETPTAPHTPPPSRSKHPAHGKPSPFRPDWARRRAAGALLALVAFHLIVNGWWLRTDNHALREDEAYHMGLARDYYEAWTAPRHTNTLERAIAVLQIDTWQGPLLAYLGAASIGVFGYDRDNIAWVTSLLLPLLILGGYAFARHLLARREAFLVAAAFSFTPIIFASSRYFLNDFLSAVLVVWAIVALLRSDGFHRTGYALAFGALAGLGLLARQTTIVFLVTPLLVVLLAPRDGLPTSSRAPGRVLVNLVAALAACLSVAAPWYTMRLPYQYAFWSGPRGQELLEAEPLRLVIGALVGPILILLVAFAGYRILKPRWRKPKFRRGVRIAAALALLLVILLPTRWANYPIHVINNGVFLPLFLLALAGLLWAPRKHLPSVAWLTAAAWLVGAFVLMTILFKANTPRYALPAVMPLVLFAMLALLAIKAPQRRKAALTALTVYLLLVFVNLTFASFGLVGNLWLPIKRTTAFAEDYGDRGLALWKDRIIAGNYGFAAVQRDPAFDERILALMLDDMQTRRRIDSPWANYQVIADHGIFEGMWFNQRHYWPEPNPIANELARNAGFGARPLRLIGSRWNEAPTDLVDQLKETDFIVLATTFSDEGEGRANRWQQFFENRDFEALTRLVQRKENNSPATRYTVLGRSVPEYALFRRWNFQTQPQEQWRWTFPHGFSRTDAGARVVMPESGPIAILSPLDFTSDQFDFIRVHLPLTVRVSGRTLDVPLSQVHFYWARPHEVPQDGWPFSTERAVRLYPVGPGEPHVFEGDPGRHPLWDGSIAAAFIGVQLPVVEPPDYAAVSSWDFRTDAKDSWWWSFPAGAARINRGALSMPGASETLMERTAMHQPATRFSQVVYTGQVFRKRGGQELPADFAGLHLYWKREGDTDYHPTQSAAFSRHDDPSGSTRWVAELGQHPQWNGVITALRIDAPIDQSIPLEGEDHFVIYSEAVQFLAPVEDPARQTHEYIINARTIQFLKRQ